MILEDAKPLLEFFKLAFAVENVHFICKFFKYFRQLKDHNVT